jgi:hypothetical protein
MAVGAAVLALTGCAAVSSQGRMVEAVHSAGEVAGMRFVGNVATSSPLAGVAFQHSSYQNALNKALNETAALGGTHLLLDPESSARFWGVYQTVRGKAYRK